MKSFKMILSAPIAAGIVAFTLVASGGGALAAPFNMAAAHGTATQSSMLIDVDHRGRGGWHSGQRGGYQNLGPRQIRRSLRHRGFRQIEILDRRGPVYVVNARGWRGHSVRLVVDSRTAQILRRQPVGHHKGRGRNW